MDKDLSVCNAAGVVKRLYLPADLLDSRTKVPRSTASDSKNRSLLVASSRASKTIRRSITSRALLSSYSMPSPGAVWSTIRASDSCKAHQFVLKLIDHAGGAGRCVSAFTTPFK